ncbi:hypothetical protein [Clostridium tarantellae]|uniref:Uncharacterized protein n=1 Tax=Clostridium tarantellae TaxID=39493 RepID=A0A6I1MVA2_9CLOT|nr:hypothetical protein [Clostridium tarantellae]MPQ44771.1 hypothetical protein [Clostridium tarantellae]
MQSINYLFTNYLLADLVSNDNPNKYFNSEKVNETLNSMWNKMHLKYGKEKKENLLISIENLDISKKLIIIKFPKPEITPESLYAGFILGEKIEKGILFTFDMSPGFDFNKAQIKTEQNYTLFKWINGKRNLIKSYSEDNLQHFSKILKENL